MRKLFVVGGLLAIMLQGLVGLLLGVFHSSASGLLCLGFVALVVVWHSAAVILLETGIHAIEITDTSVTLKCVSQAFVDAIRARRETARRV